MLAVIYEKVEGCARTVRTRKAAGKRARAMGGFFPYSVVVNSVLRDSRDLGFGAKSTIRIERASKNEARPCPYLRTL